MILVVDNHGFTTRILAHQLGEVEIVSAAELATANLADYTHVVVSHGTADADLQTLQAVPNLPVLAIGAGADQLAQLYGHTEMAATQPNYGQQVAHRHTDTGLFAGLPQRTQLTSYHSRRLTTMDSTTFRVHAVDDDDDDAVLAFRVNGTNHWGLHADPAALQSTEGSHLVENFLTLAPRDDAKARHSSPMATRKQPQELFRREIPGVLDTAATFAALQQDATAAFWLDSAAAHVGQGDTTIMGTNSGDLAQTVRWDVTSNRLDVSSATQTTHHIQDVLDYLHDHAWEPMGSVEMPGFTGGWVGYLGYEAKQATTSGHTNTWTAATPDAYWIRPQTFLRYDHRRETTTLFAYGDSTLLDASEKILVFGETAPPASAERSEFDGSWGLTTPEYQQHVLTIQAMLHSGDAAGICLTDMFSMPADEIDGLELYMRLRANNPAPYAGYLRFNTFGDAVEVLSASPEKFLSVDASGTIESKPIKGTGARSTDPAVDAQVASKMAVDAKIQSENLMITDLLRDDLAVVATPGSVQVPKLMDVETFATVHQLVTTVTGQLLPGTAATEALRAVFPGGSMTGAPKLASLEALEELEAGPRGIYSGAMGWLGDDNTAELNVVIRSIVIADGQLTIGAGGAVVVGSDPVAEEQEKHLKARSLMHSIAEQL